MYERIEPYHSLLHAVYLPEVYQLILLVVDHWGIFWSSMNKSASKAKTSFKLPIWNYQLSISVPEIYLIVGSNAKNIDRNISKPFCQLVAFVSFQNLCFRWHLCSWRINWPSRLENKLSWWQLGRDKRQVPLARHIPAPNNNNNNNNNNFLFSRGYF